MRSSHAKGFVGLALLLCAGCGQQIAGEPPTQSTGAADESRAVARSQDSAPPETSPANSRRLAVALDRRTVMGQTLPEEVHQAWCSKLSSLGAEMASVMRIVHDPAEANWLVQVAALERTDIVYLTPVQRDGAAVGDNLLRMLAPGESSLTNLKTELEYVAEHGTLSPLPEPLASDAAPTDVEAEARPEPNVPPPAEKSESLLTALGAAIDRAARERLGYEKLRQEALKRHEEEQSFKASAVFGIAHRGPAEDLKAEVVEEQSALYHTSNRTQAVLGTYGKMVRGNHLANRLAHFEQRGIVQRLDSARRFITVQRMGNGIGKDWVSFAGNRQAWQFVDLAAQLSANRRQQIAFEIVGVRLDQNDVIHALNTDSDALSYFDYLRQHAEKPCFVLENVVFTSYSIARDASITLGGKGRTALSPDSVEGRVGDERSSFTRLTSPVIRCYQAYEVKLDGRQVVELTVIEP